MMDSGKMTKPMVMVLINMQMVQPMSETGKMINNMERELRPGPMEPSTKVNMQKARNMAKEL